MNTPGEVIKEWIVNRVLALVLAQFYKTGEIDIHVAVQQATQESELIVDQFCTEWKAQHAEDSKAD